MKTILLLFLLLASGLRADEASLEIVTTDGKKYSGVTVRKVEPDGLSILHSNGVAKVPFEKLPEDIRSKYGFDEAEAAEHREKLAEAERRAVEAQRDAREKQRGEARDEEAGKVDNDFADKVTKAAKMMKVVAFQNAKVGLIGDISEGTLTSEPVKNRLGSTVGTKPKWVFKAPAIDGVISGTNGAEAITSRDDTGNPDGLPSTYETNIEWQGKAWRIGLIQYRTQQGLIRTCPHYTASETEAASFYKRNGFSPKSDTIARKAY